MMKEEKSKRLLSHKVLLVLIKYIPHIIALFYAIYDILGILGVDAIIFGHLIHVSLVTWLFMYFLSFVFRYCYVHRLPLYYILGSDTLTITDYLLDFTIEESITTLLHLSLIAVIIFGYTYYYDKNIKKSNSLVIR